MGCISFLETCPASGDTEQQLLSKILQVLNDGGGGGGGAGVSSISVNGGAAQTGAVSLTIPAALFNFKDQNANADGVVYINSGATEVFRTVGTSGFLKFTTNATTMRLHTSALDDSFTFLASPAKADGAFLEVYGTSHATGLGGATVSIHDGGQFRVRSAPVASTTSVIRAVIDGTTGFLGIATDTPPFPITVQREGAGAYIASDTYRSSAFAGGIIAGHARGTAAVPTFLSNGDRVFSLFFKAWDGTASKTISQGSNAASIEVFADGVHDATHTPGRLVFSTALALTETARLTINSVGFVGLGPSTTPSANLDVNNLSTATISYFYCTTDGLAAPVNYRRVTIDTSSATNQLIRTEAAGTGLTAGQPRILQVGTGPSVGTDIAGQNVILHAGPPTGSGVPGAILFQQGLPVGGTGTAVTALATIWQISTAGVLTGSAGFGITLNAANIATDTSTGTKIGTATNQKIGFYNATPIVQGASVADATGGAIIDAEARTAINALISRIEALGLIATV